MNRNIQTALQAELVIDDGDMVSVTGRIRMPESRC